MKMSLNIYATIFLSIIAVVPFAAAGPISHSKRHVVEDRAEEKNFVANIVKDILSKVAHAGAHRAGHNDTDAVTAKNTTEEEEDSLSTVFDEPSVSASENATAPPPALPFLPEAQNATSAESFTEEERIDDEEVVDNADGLEDEDDHDDEFVDDDDDDDFLLDDDVPLMNLDPGSEYVLKVFEKLQKGNSMESATKELTTKLSHEHR